MKKLLIAIILLCAIPAGAQTPPNGAGKVIVWDSALAQQALAPYFYVSATSPSASWWRLGSSAWTVYGRAYPAGYLCLSTTQTGECNGGILGRSVALGSSSEDSVYIQAGAGNAILQGSTMGIAWNHPLWGSPDTGLWRYAPAGDGTVTTGVDAQGLHPTPFRASAFVQSSGPSWATGPGAPSGPCTTGSLYTRTDTGVLSVCESGVWTSK